ncbi:MAG: CHAP domain-containing protein, partial [Armatimonadota bacterium]
MRHLMLTTVALVIAMGAWAESLTGPRSIVSELAAQVENDLGTRSVARRADGADASDPLTRARSKLPAWTRVPSRDGLMEPGAAAGILAGATLEGDGLMHEYFPDLDQTLAFPVGAETAPAIRRMARGEVSAAPNRCAGTMREALGWGLGDAHQWTSLPSRGYWARPPGATAHPGDIVVWPFTYGRRNSQHIGIAVGTEAGTML